MDEPETTIATDERTAPTISPGAFKALRKEYAAWKERIGSDGTLNGDKEPVVNENDLRLSRLSPKDTARLRRLLFADLVGLGFDMFAICGRLAIGSQTYKSIRSKLVAAQIDEDERQRLAAEMLARMRRRLDDLRNMRIAIGTPDSNADRKMVVDIIKTEQDVEAAICRIVGLYAPERKEVSTKRSFSVTLSVHGSRQQLADILDNPNAPDMPAFPLPASRDTVDVKPRKVVKDDKWFQVPSFE